MFFSHIYDRSARIHVPADAVNASRDGGRCGVYTSAGFMLWDELVELPS